MYKDVIGIIGGFGAYATLGFYKRMLEEFASASEREYPHMVFDNDFTMPSRTKALLYGDDYETVVKMIAASMDKMCKMNADYIVMVCGTAHAFLQDVFKICPDARSKVINIINELKNELSTNEVNRVLIIAAEGTLKSGVYEKSLEGIECIVPTSDMYSRIRGYIEAVKRNEYTSELKSDFVRFLGEYNASDIVLGCTELPIFVNTCYRDSDILDGYTFWDPLEATIKKIKKILN